MSRVIALLVAAMIAAPVSAQETAIDFGGLRQDTTQPVEVASDALEVNQSDGTATFSGNVVVSQGAMRLSAGRITAIYAGEASAGRIRELRAEEGVTLVAGEDAAEAQSAVYDIDEGSVVMTGDVLLTQGPTALSSERLVIDLVNGTGSLEGRVRTIFETGER
ncbi:LptA/OstA family protein [Palleronia aestuarii]|nr:LptA/OstA family protein [Palleronia aestuarii]